MSSSPTAGPVTMPGAKRISLRLILAATDIYDVRMVDGTDHSIEVNMLAESTEDSITGSGFQHAPHQAGGLPRWNCGSEGAVVGRSAMPQPQAVAATWRARRRVLPRAAARCPEVRAPR